MRTWFETDPDRFQRFSLSAASLFLDYSRNRITPETMDALVQLANACHLKDNITALFSGEPLNHTEGRPALHTALRDPHHQPVMVNGENIAARIAETNESMRTFTRRIHTGEWRGATGKRIESIVTIGIGGSYAGPMMCDYALREFAVSPLRFYFISSVDKSPLDHVLQHIDPETTLFIISSKSFTTIETLTNARTVLTWMKQRLGTDVMPQHVIAVTAAPEKAIAFGIPANNIFPLWEWVGGRYSIWSAIGLPLLLMLGEAQFNAFLSGAYAMDQHFREAEFSKNMPVILALLGIWYTNFFGASTQAIIPYTNRLRYFIPYLQQADMESNGKHINRNGQPLSYTTGPVLFGEEGVIGQHAYHQLLHQGKHFIPVDFILTGRGQSQDEHQDILIASALSQAQALMRGKSFPEAREALLAKQVDDERASALAPHQVIPGNKPSNILVLNQLTPYTLGALIALYEHKIFVQGTLWNINSFDQWGVELGKQLLPDILAHVQGATTNSPVDTATASLISVLSR